MKQMTTWLITLVLMNGVAMAAPQSTEQRVANELAIYTEVLELTEEQSTAIEKGLTDKITVGREAYEIKKGGDEAEGKKMNQAAGKEFHNLLRTTLSKDQMNTYKARRDEIKDAIKKAR